MLSVITYVVMLVFCWFDRTISMSDIPSDIDKKTLIELYTYHCPTAPTCSAGAVNQTSLTNSCCPKCSCNYKCEMEEKCCPDFLLDNYNLIKRPMSCYRNQLLPYKSGVYVNSPNTFYMVDTCAANHKQQENIDKCKHGGEYPSSYDISIHLPVYSPVTQKTYRNKYCALCNGENIHNLESWRLKIACKDTQPDIFVTARQLMEYILGQLQCNVYFLPPTTSTPLEVCSRGWFFECNMTGNWRTYNKDIEWACTHFSGVYNFNYRNVFCYLCNNSPAIVEECIYDDGYNIGEDFFDTVGSFNALMDFNAGTSMSEIRGKCSSIAIYDGLKKVCRDVHCMAPSQYKDKKCQNVFYKKTNGRLDIFLRFDKKSNDSVIDEYCIFTAGAAIYGYLMHLIAFKSQVCHITLLQKSPETFQYIFVHIELFFDEYDGDLFEAALKILDSLATMDAVYGRPNDCMDMNPKVLHQQFYEVNRETIELHPTFRHYIDPTDGQNLTYNPYMDILNRYKFEINNCPDYSWVLRVTRVNLCPTLEISMNEFNISVQRDFLCVLDIDLCLQSDEYILDANTSNVKICSQTYISQIARYIDTGAEDNLVQTIVSFMCSCLSILCLAFLLATYALFSKLRTLPGMNNMALSSYLLCAYVLYTFGMNATSSVIFCKVIGILIHLAFMNAIMMMNVCCFAMFKTFYHLKQKSLLTKKQMVISFSVGLLYSFIISSSLVTANVLYSVYTTADGDIGYGGSVCYINQTRLLLFTFAIPIAVVLLANIIMFIIVVVKIHRLPNMRESCSHHRQNIKIYAKLSTITGMAMVFGYVKELFVHEIFTYIFVVLNASQGVFIMVSFVCNRRVLEMYKSLLCKCMHSGDTTTASTTNTQITSPQSADTECLSKERVAEESTQSTGDIPNTKTSTAGASSSRVSSDVGDSSVACVSIADAMVANFSLVSSSTDLNDKQIPTHITDIAFSSGLPSPDCTNSAQMTEKMSSKSEAKQKKIDEFPSSSEKSNSMNSSSSSHQRPDDVFIINTKM